MILRALSNVRNKLSMLENYFECNITARTASMFMFNLSVSLTEKPSLPLSAKSISTVACAER